MGKAGGGTRGYAKRHGFRVANVPRNQTRLREKYRYVVTGGPGRGGRMYAKNLSEASSMMRGSVKSDRLWNERSGR